MGEVKLNGGIKTCETCNFSKSTRESFHEKRDIQTLQILELLHLAIWGLVHIPSLGNAIYFLTIIDYFCNSFVRILTHKNPAIEYLKNSEFFRKANR